MTKRARRLKPGVDPTKLVPDLGEVLMDENFQKPREWRDVSPEEKQLMIIGVLEDLENIVKKIQMIPFTNMGCYTPGPLGKLFKDVGEMGDILERRIKALNE